MIWEILLSASIETVFGVLADAGVGDSIKGLRDQLFKIDEKKRRAALQQVWDKTIAPFSDIQIKELLLHKPFQEEVVRALLDSQKRFDFQSTDKYWKEKFPEQALDLELFFNTLQNNLLDDPIWGPIVKNYQDQHFQQDVRQALESKQLTVSALVKAVGQTVDRYDANLSGIGAIAQGPGAKAVAGGLLVEGSVQKIVQITIQQFITPGLLQEYLPATAPTDYFVGRQILREKVGAVLREEKQARVSIIGMGGSGKTALAQQIVSDIGSSFDNNIFWGDLHETNGNPTSILTSWVSLCRRELPIGMNNDALAGHLKGLLTQRLEETGAMLIVIDDLRQEWQDAGELLLKAVPNNVPVMVTSRDQEIKQVLTGVKKVLVFSLDKDLLSDSEAWEILMHFSNKQLTEEHSKQVTTICEKMPLALKLAAQVAGNRGSEYLLKKLADAKTRLAGLRRGSSDRKKESVKATFDISYNALEENTKLTFRYLAAFASAPITSNHLTNVLLNSSNNNIDVDEELYLLRSRSLLQDTSDTRNRNIGTYYRMHALLHDYAYEKLLEIELEINNARMGHFMCFQNLIQDYSNVDLANRANEKTREFELFHPQFENALDNYEALNPQDRDSQALPVIQFIKGMDKYWTLYSHFKKQNKWLRIGHDYAKKAGNRIETAAFAERIGRVLERQGKLEEALQWMYDCEAYLDGIQDEHAYPVRALMYIHRAAIFYNQDIPDLKRAQKDASLGVELADQNQYLSVYAEGKNMLGAIQLEKGKLSVAIKEFEQSRIAWRQVGDQYQISRVEANIRSTLYDLGEVAQLRDEEDESLKYWKQFPGSDELAMALTNRALVYYLDGEYDFAIELQQQAMEIGDSLMAQNTRASTRNELARIYIDLKNYDKAEEYLKESRQIQKGGSNTIYCLVKIEIGRKQYDNAIANAKKLLALANSPLEKGAALRLIGQTYHEKGDLTQVGKYLEKSLTTLQRKGYKYELFCTRQALAKLYNDMGDDKKAKIEWGYAKKLLTEMGIRRSLEQ